MNKLIKTDSSLSILNFHEINFNFLYLLHPTWINFMIFSCGIAHDNLKDNDISYVT